MRVIIGFVLFCVLTIPVIAYASGGSLTGKYRSQMRTDGSLDITVQLKISDCLICHRLVNGVTFVAE